jgi:hypothetical protein
LKATARIVREATGPWIELTPSADTPDEYALLLQLANRLPLRFRLNKWACARLGRDLVEVMHDDIEATWRGPGEG